MRIILVVALVSIVLLSACNGNKSNTNESKINANANTNSAVAFKPPEPLKPDQPVDPNFKSCNSYYPLVPGAQLQFTMVHSTGLVSDVRVVHSSAEENGAKVLVEKTQIIDTGGGLKKTENTIKKFVCDGERVKLISWVTDNTVEGNTTHSENRPRRDVYVMIDPDSLSHVGTKWSFTIEPVFRAANLPGETPLDPLPIRFEVKGVEQVTVPAGKFNALKVIQTVNQNEATLYFVRGLGLVRRDLDEGTKMELKEYSGLKPIE